MTREELQLEFDKLNNKINELIKKFDSLIYSLEHPSEESVLEAVMKANKARQQMVEMEKGRGRVS